MVKGWQYITFFFFPGFIYTYCTRIFPPEENTETKGKSNFQAINVSELVKSSGQSFRSHCFMSFSSENIEIMYSHLNELEIVIFVLTDGKVAVIFN